MKPTKPTKSVEEICQAIERFQLMSSKDYPAMRARWFRPNRADVNDPEAFRRWLVINRYVTEFAAKVVSGSKPDQLVLNQYRLVDQLIAGPMAGSYIAIDPLERRVAVEVLSSASASDQEVLVGFQHAALQAMKVQHPNVGRILDTGEAHKLYYLVKEHYEGQTLEEILEKRGRLPYLQATRLMALALAGVEALHAQGVTAGDLTADCLLLVQASKESQGQKTVKILHAGIKRKLFDETAIGRTVSSIQLIPDELELAKSCTFQLANAGAVVPCEDIFRLGCLFYRSITGQAPYTEHELLSPSKAPRPIRDLAPEVPEMLAEIIDQMVAPKPADRQQKAAHVAKALRVFLAAEEQGRETKAEENIVVASASRPSRRRQEEDATEDEEREEPEDEDPEDDEEPVGRGARSGGGTGVEGAYDKVLAMWNEIHPEVRDLMFLAAGALLMLTLIFLVQFVTGIHLAYVAGLATGAAASYFVECFLRWRQEKKAGSYRA